MNTEFIYDKFNRILQIAETVAEMVTVTKTETVVLLSSIGNVLQTPHRCKNYCNFSNDYNI